jgi:PAS domain S-box-containing protein
VDPLNSVTLAAELLDGVPHVMFCVKNLEGCYVRVNQAFAERVGRRRAIDVVGRTASDLFPKELSASYTAQDHAVATTGRPVYNHLERITRPDGSVGWYVTSKVIVRNNEGVTTGIASISVDLHQAYSSNANSSGVAAALQCARERFHEPLRVADLAEAAKLSPAQLERRMRQLLGVSAKQLIIRTRIDQAAYLLATTDLQIATVAAQSGFYDHSQFTKQFATLTGLSPSAYRSGAQT